MTPAKIHKNRSKVRLILAELRRRKCDNFRVVGLALVKERAK
jgi:hypothetical protein